MAGRGAYLCRRTAAECLAMALKRRAVSRSLRLGHDVIEGSALSDQLSRLTAGDNP